MAKSSLIKEFVNQADLKKSDGSDAGKTDVADKGATDVKFSLMRNTINSDGKVTGSDVANYLEKAADLNDEVDTVLYGLETDDGQVVKVYVNATEADAFEVEMKKLLGMQDDIEEAITALASKFDIVDVIWPKNPEDAPADGEDDLDLDSTAQLGDDGEADDDMEVIADVNAGPAEEAAEDEAGEDEAGEAGEDEAGEDEAGEDEGDEAGEAATDDDDEDDKADKKDDKKKNKHDKLKNVGKNMKVAEALQVGWYVTDGNDKTIAGPVEEAEARAICKKKGGDAKGFTVSYISDYDARRANETQGDNMSIGNKFLERVLSEAKEDRDGVMDGFDIQLDSQQRALAAKLKWKLPKQIIATFALVGIPGVKLNTEGIEDSVQEAAEMLRSNLSVRRAFMDFYKAFATAAGKTIEKEAVTEAKLKRGSYLQKQLETVLVKLGLPEDLILVTGPGVVGSALFRAAKMIEDNGDLKEKLRMLAVRMGIKPSDAMAPIEEEVELKLGATMQANVIEQLIKALKLETVFNVRDMAAVRRQLQAMKLPPAAIPQMKRLIVTLGGETPQQAAQGTKPTV